MTETPASVAADAAQYDDDLLSQLVAETRSRVAPGPQGHRVAVPADRDHIEEFWWTAVRLGMALERERPATAERVEVEL